MPAYLVELPTTLGQTLLNGNNRFVVFAATTADAKDIVKDQFAGFSSTFNNNLVAAATVTEIVAGTSLAGYMLNVKILDSTPEVNETVTATGVSMVKSIAINNGGTGYSGSDVLTVLGGTGTSCTITVDSVDGSGVITAASVTTLGAYTVDPSVTANAVTGGGGSAATFDLTLIDDTIETLAILMSEALNSTSIIANSSFNLSTNVLTIATGSGGDDLGDKTVEVKLYAPNGHGVISSFVTTIVDEGVSTDPLSATFITETTAIPVVVAALKA